MKHKLFFDPENNNWSKDQVANLLFLRTVQNYLNARARIQGYLFVNDVREVLGFERTREGQTHGWHYQNEKFGQGIVFYNYSEPVVGEIHDHRFRVEFSDQGEILDQFPSEES